MKKVFILAVSAFLASTTVFAENRFGATGGVNINYNNDLKGWQKPSLGANAGITWEHSFGNNEKGHPFINVGLLYSLVTTKLKEELKVDWITEITSEEAHTEKKNITEEHKFDTRLLRTPITGGYNFQLSEKLGLAPKAGVVFEKDFQSSMYGFNTELGLNLNIGDRIQIGLAHEWVMASHIKNSGWYHENLDERVHANLTFYIF